MTLPSYFIEYISFSDQIESNWIGQGINCSTKFVVDSCDFKKKLYVSLNCLDWYKLFDIPILTYVGKKLNMFNIFIIYFYW